jgi:uncharacterized membrane protein YdfJ with MMPL/SSD domain
MFERLGEVMFRRRRAVGVLALIVIVLGGLWGGSVSKHLSGGGYYDPHSESVLAGTASTDDLGVPRSDAIALFTSAASSVTDPSVEAVIESSLASLPRTAVTAYESYGTTRSAALISQDRHETYASLQLAGTGDSAQEHSLAVAKRVLTADVPPGVTVAFGGTVPLNQQISGQVSTDLKKAETLSLPILLILLIVIFGSLVSAGLPLAVGLVAIVGAAVVLRLLTEFVSVSVFALNLVTMLGLGLAVDYALFMISRFREELGRDPDVVRAVRRTMATAGRTVAFSGVTVAISLASLTLFPETFLRSMGYGGVAVVLVDMVAALTVLPALLGMLGHRVDGLRIPNPLRRGRAAVTEAHTGPWYRLAHSVMRRPLAYAVPIVVVLLVMAAPFAHVTFGGYTAKVLPAGSQGLEVTNALAADFPANSTAPIEVVVEDLSKPSDLASYVAQLAKVPGVLGAQVTATRGRDALDRLGYDGDPIAATSRTALNAVRTVPPPPGTHVLVGGQTAFLVDQLHSIGHILPWMLGVIVVAMLVLLFLAFGSFVLPVKAVVMNALSISASFGVVTWIFQGGHLTHLLHFSKLGYLDATDPILMLAVIFGLSMDYEVFLLSRIREEWDSSHDNAGSVATGLQRSGRIITSAALLLVIVIGAFSTSRVTTLKLLGVGMALAIVVDATFVRAMLVPAVMRLLGDRNWWAPAPVERWWRRHGVVEASVPEAERRHHDDVSVGGGPRDGRGAGQ